METHSLQSKPSAFARLRCATTSRVGGVFPWEKLPAELRCMIYQQVFSDTNVFDRAVRDYKSKSSVQATPDDECFKAESATASSPPKKPAVPALLHTTRAIRKEAFPYYFRYRRWRVLGTVVSGSSFIQFLDVIAPPKSSRRAQLIQEALQIDVMLLDYTSLGMFGLKRNEFVLPGFVWSERVLLKPLSSRLADHIDRALQKGILGDLFRLAGEAQRIVHRHVGHSTACFYDRRAIIEKLNSTQKALKTSQEEIKFKAITLESEESSRSMVTEVQATLIFGHCAHALPCERSVTCAVNLAATKHYGHLWNAHVTVDAYLVSYLAHREERISGSDSTPPDECCDPCQYMTWDEPEDEPPDMAIQIKAIPYGQPIKRSRYERIPVCRQPL